MKRGLSFLLILMLTFGLMPSSFAKTGEQNGDSLVIVQPGGGPYLIVTELTPGHLSLKYGWHNLNSFETQPVRCRMRIHMTSDLEQRWVYVVSEDLDPAPEHLRLNMSTDSWWVISGCRYWINLYITCANINDNVSLNLIFIAP